MIACHYDSKISPKGFLGATDSAVPCAQMINLATVMKNDLNAQKNKVRIFVKVKKKVQNNKKRSFNQCVHNVTASLYSRIQKSPFNLFSLMEKKLSNDGHLLIVFTDLAF